MPVKLISNRQSTDVAFLQYTHPPGFFMRRFCDTAPVSCDIFIHDYFWKYTQYKNIYRGCDHHHDMLLLN
jgi:hypothetical protein